MRSIIEEIAQSEQQADEIRAEAAAHAREEIARAAEEAERALAALDVSAREETAAALAKAERDGEALAQSLSAQYEAEADTLCAQAYGRVDEAVDYLIKKVQGIA